MTHVTTPLSVLFNHASEGIPEEVIFHASERGKQVHSLIARTFQERLPLLLLPKEVAGYIRSFNSWAALALECVYEVEEDIEIPEHKIIGRVDLIAQIKGNQYRTVIDWKTPSVNSPLWRGQMAVYLKGAQRKFSNVKDAITIQLFKDGKTAKARSYQNAEQDYQAYLSLLYGMRYFLGDKI